VVHAKGCAFHTRTVAMTFGQRLVIQGEDNRPYVPEILGQPQPAQLFVLPTMPRVSIAPQNPGLFKLVDSMRLFSVAELYVLPYRTVAVTGLDGHFEIQGIPAGPVRIDALLPQTSGVTGRDLVIEPGKTLDINLQIAFDRSAWDKAPKAAALETRPAQEGARLQRRASRNHRLSRGSSWATSSNASSSSKWPAEPDWVRLSSIAKSTKPNAHTSVR
jgi:hypothetical protein